MQSNAADGEAVDFEPEDDDLMDEEAGSEADTSASPRGGGSHALPKLKSAITGGPSSSLSGPKKTKGRGFRQDTDVDGNTRFAGSDFDSLKSSGWIILVTGLHGEPQEDYLHEAFAGFGEINLHLNVERRTALVKGYALIEYGTFKEAQHAISEMNEAELLTQTIYVDWAFSEGPSINRSMKRKNLRSHQEGRSRSQGRSRSPRRRRDDISIIPW